MGNDPGAKTTGQYLTPAEIAYFAKQQWKSPAWDDIFNVPIAVAIAMAESSGNTKAHNVGPTDDSYGLWQINMKGSLGPARRKQFAISADTALLDPSVNAKAAHQIFLVQGWGAWSTYTNGAYKKFMDAATTAAKNPKKPDGYMPPIGGRIDNETAGSNPIDQFFSPILDFLKDAGIRTAGFVGGLGLLILAIVLFVKKGAK
jgi:hypothetical protein